MNELFFPGRMAYVMDLEEEAESDIPTTTIRSKKDVAINDQKATLSTNDIVINKLTQILSYLRAGSRTKKKKKVNNKFKKMIFWLERYCHSFADFLAVLLDTVVTVLMEGGWAHVMFPGSFFRPGTGYLHILTSKNVNRLLV